MLLKLNFILLCCALDHLRSTFFSCLSDLDTSFTSLTLTDKFKYILSANNRCKIIGKHLYKTRNQLLNLQYQPANRQLSDDQYYHPLDTDPTETISSEIRSFLTEMAERGTIDSSTKAFLTPLNPRPGRFYMLPKIHKPNNPGRPIISSCDAPTKKISMFVDHHLRPHVEQLPSYLRDTTHFLTRIQGLDTPPPGTLLVTLDVKSLYTNIPHADGIEACREALDTRTHLQPPTEDLIELTRLVLTKNIFTFAGQHYLQTHGTAMGTRAAPSYANIFMGRLENQILAEADKKPHVWWRYIDDVFAMWTHGENHLKDFLEHLNQAHPTIRFTADWSPDSMSFLDVTITLKDGEVQTDLYSKSTDMHQYLAMSSCHPRHCKQAIPYGQALRLHHICSEEHQFKQRTTELKQYLIRRGHNPAQVQQSIDKAAAVPRESALQPSEKRKNNRVPLVTTYDPRLPRLSEITKNHLPVLHVSDKLKGAINPRSTYYSLPPPKKTSEICW